MTVRVLLTSHPSSRIAVEDIEEEDIAIDVREFLVSYLSRAVCSMRTIDCS